MIGSGQKSVIPTLEGQDKADMNEASVKRENAVQRNTKALMSCGEGSLI